MVTKAIAQIDCFAEKAKSKFVAHRKAIKGNRGAEMLEIALAVGVVMLVYMAFKKLGGSMSKKLDNAREAVDK